MSTKHLCYERLALAQYALGQVREQRDAARAKVADLKARLKAARELHWAISLVEREAFDALLRATDLRVKNWRKP